jgi:hypothetical protein
MVTTGRKASCRGKRKFATSAGARLALKNAKAAGRPEKRAYKCPVCDYWHLTSKEEA